MVREVNLDVDDRTPLNSKSNDKHIQAVFKKKKPMQV